MDKVAIKRNMSTESKCIKALESVKNLLADKEYRDCYEYIRNHNEWLLGLEFAVDYLSEDEKIVSSQSYELFQYAFAYMKQTNNSRLEDLKSLVNDEI
jgi:hypothetical protein